MIYPKKLRSWDEIRVIAPSRSLAICGSETIGLAQRELEREGFVVTYSKNAMEMDLFRSSSIESRIDDIHEAFSDPSVKGILTAIGGFNSNQLLGHLDYELIRNHPKIVARNHRVSFEITEH